MRNLKDTLNVLMFESFMAPINESIICESLESSYLTNLAKQLKKMKSKQDSFGAIFGRLTADWANIKDSDFVEYKAGDKEGIKKTKAILSNSTGWINSMVLFKSQDNPNEFVQMVCWRGVFGFNGKKWNYETQEYTGKVTYEEKYLQKWLKEDCEKYDFLYLDLSKFDVNKLKGERMDSRRGMVLQGDVWYYDKLARENKERYEKIIAQRKAERAAKEDTVAQDVQDIVNELMDLAARAAKNPDLFVSVNYELSSAIEEVYSTKYYDRGTYHGKNGLLYLFKEYLHNHMNIYADGGYNFQRKGQDSIKKQIDEQISWIRKKIDKIYDKIS